MSYKDLVKEFSTPLFVLDANLIKAQCERFILSAEKFYPDSLILYASKANCSLAVLQLVSSYGLGVDVASGGELYTALAAKISPDKIYFHGNNKTENEIEMAVTKKQITIVVDSFEEIERVAEISKKEGVLQKVMLRVNPSVEAHTHHYIQTAKDDSKFGLSILSGAALEAVKRITAKKSLSLVGLHCHIGSQIFQVEPFLIALEKMVDFIATLPVTIDKLNLGGGFGIKYTDADEELSIETLIEKVSERLKALVKEKNIKPPALILEPGRSIIGGAGTTLYTVGCIKKTPSGKIIVAVDGGMFENPRYALYGAKYSGFVVGKENKPKGQRVTIVGKCCESGDIIADDVFIQGCNARDILAIEATGAYNYSMASNYNRNLIPPTVLIKDDVAKIIVKPQTYADIIRLDVPLNNSKEAL